MLYATSHSYGASQNSTIRNFVLPGPISIKLGVIDYVGDPYLYANFGWIWLGGKFPANTWNITSVWLFVVSLFFVHSPVTKTRERICTINGLKRVKSGTEKSNLRSNFTPEVVLSPFLCMRMKSGQSGSKPGQNSGYVRNRNPAKTWSIRQKFMTKRKQVMYNFSNKVVD